MERERGKIHALMIEKCKHTYERDKHIEYEYEKDTQRSFEKILNKLVKKTFAVRRKICVSHWKKCIT